MSPTGIECTIPDSRVPLILAGNVFVVVDDGAAVATDYPIIERIIVKHARRYPGGLACLTVVPPNARPPREEIRDAIREALGNVKSHLASVCWYLEGTGFKAAAARAVLSGLIIILNPRYPSHITSDLNDALAWSFARAGGGAGVDVVAVARQIDVLRRTVDRSLLQPAAL